MTTVGAMAIGTITTIGAGTVGMVHLGVGAGIVGTVQAGISAGELVGAVGTALGTAVIMAITTGIMAVITTITTTIMEEEEAVHTVIPQTDITIQDQDTASETTQTMLLAEEEIMVLAQEVLQLLIQQEATQASILPEAIRLETILTVTRIAHQDQIPILHNQEEM